MKICRSYNCLIAVSIILSLSTFSCGMRYTVKGRVIDAETEKPIEGAAVNIEWNKYILWPPIPLGSNYKRVAEYEAVTDPEGYFKIKKHLFRESDWCVAKKGYVFWSDEMVFNPEGTLLYDKRDKHISLKSGMIIKLKPFKPHYSRFQHGKFISSATSLCPCRQACRKEILTELRYYRNKVQRKRGIK